MSPTPETVGPPKPDASLVIGQISAWLKEVAPEKGGDCCGATFLLEPEKGCIHPLYQKTGTLRELFTLGGPGFGNIYRVSLDLGKGYVVDWGGKTGEEFYQIPDGKSRLCQTFNCLGLGPSTGGEGDNPFGYTSNFSFGIYKIQPCSNPGVLFRDLLERLIGESPEKDKLARLVKTGLEKASIPTKKFYD